VRKLFRLFKGKNRYRRQNNGFGPENSGGPGGSGPGQLREGGGGPALPAISTSVTQPDWQMLDLTRSLADNIKMFKAIFAGCSDLVFHEFNFAQHKDLHLAVIYVDGLAERALVNESIIRPLSLELPLVTRNTEPLRGRLLEIIRRNGLCVPEIEETGQVKKAVNAILSGDTALLIDGQDTALLIDTRGWEMRAIEDSYTDRLVRGPREAFVETLRINTALLRRKIKNPALKIEALTLGQVTQTDVAVAYVEGIANPKIVAEVKNRLGRIAIDSVLEGGYLEELIEDHPLSPFCTINHSDRVDKIAALLLEGRVAVLVDGSPFALTVPALFVELLHNPEDYYNRYLFMSPVRALRIFAFFVTLLTSSFYVSLITFHPELLPTPLLLSIAAQREAVPFPAIVEVLIMEITFEILREAGLRMPLPLGQAVSIVGALVLGEAAVRAGLVAPATVIVIATTAIASFTFCYSASLVLRLLRFPLLILSGFLGLPGLTFGLLAMVIHLANLRSFGVPFLYPISPLSPEELKDTGVRAPRWSLRRRPHLLTTNLIREKAALKPQPPPGPPRPGR